MPASTHNIIFGGLEEDPRGIIKAILWLIIATYLMAQPEWGSAADRPAWLANKPQAFADANGHLSPMAFEFVVPGVRRGEVDKRLGKPYISSTSVVVQGQIDLFLDDAPTKQSDPPRAPQPTEEVRYYDYRPDKFPSEHARIVFRGDKIWYAMLPPLHGEKTRAEIMARYGHVFEEQKVHRRDGHILSVDVILWLSKKGLAFVEKPSRGITYRVVFPAGDLTATRKGV